jgi:hypothetical protein
MQSQYSKPGERSNPNDSQAAHVGKPPAMNPERYDSIRSDPALKIPPLLFPAPGHSR